MSSMMNHGEYKWRRTTMQLGLKPLPWTSWPKSMATFILAFIVFAFYSEYSAPLKTLVGEQGILDMRTQGYNLEDVQALFEFLGEEGRNYYFRSTLFDTTWPLLIGISAIFSSALAFRARWIIIAAAFFPCAFGILDLIENIGFLVFLKTYPEISASWVTINTLVTQTKLTIIPPAFGCFLLLPIIASARVIRMKIAIRNGHI